jgi:hypothetical protein
MKEFLKKYKWVLFILFFIPIITVSVFGFMEFCFKKIDLKAGEWAEFIGAILGYIGTVLLGTFAFWQNEKIKEQAQKENDELKKLNQQSNDINKRLLDIQEIQFMPIIDISDNKPRYSPQNEKLTLTLVLENRGNSDIKYFTIEVMKDEEVKRLIDNKIEIIPDLLSALKSFSSINFLTKRNTEYIGNPNNGDCIGLKMKSTHIYDLELNNTQNKVVLKIAITNIYGSRYNELITFDINDDNSLYNKLLTNITWDIKKVKE